MPVRVASICPVRRTLAKPLYAPQRFWFTPPVLKGSPPFVLWFNDDIVQVNCYRAHGQFGNDPKPAEEVAQAFINANMNLPFCKHPEMTPGLWLVGSLGQDEEFGVYGGSNSGATMLQLDHAHRMDATGEISISGAIGLWAVLNGKWMASPAGENMISVPVDSRGFGEFTNGGTLARVSIKRNLTLEQEADLIRPRQEKWLERCLQDARYLWNRDKSNHRIVELHHIAAAWFGVEGEDWQTVMDSSTSLKCRYCQRSLSRDPVTGEPPATCAYCHEVANPKLHAQLKVQEEQALKAEKQKLKDAQAEIDRKIRELNKQKEAEENQEALVEQETIG